MTSIESSAVFRARGLALKLLAVDLDALATRGWSTIGTFAFSCASIPGQGNDADFVAKVVTPVLGAPDHSRPAILRRLFFECYTIAASDMRSKVDRAGDEPPKKMAGPERNARLKALRNSLNGIDLSGRMEPSFHLTDQYVQMAEEGTLRHLEWDEYSAREDELRGQKKTKDWRPDASGTIKEVTRVLGVQADLSSDLKFTQAMARRGVALHLSNLCDYQVHEKLIRYYVREVQRLPPAGYKPVSFEQILRADIEMFRMLAEKG